MKALPKEESMIASTFSQAINRLEVAFPNGKPSKEQLKIYWEKLNTYDDAAMKQSVEHFIEHDDRGRFPIIGTLLALVDTFQGQLREKELNRIKDEERAAARKLFHDELKGDDIAKGSLSLIRAAMGKDLTRQQYLDGMRQLGFTKDANELESYYAFNDLPLGDEIGQIRRCRR